MSTFEHEASLPTLPVPELSATVHQLLMAIKPLVSADEYNELLNESTDLLSNRTINLIQKHLVQASETPSQTCYLNSINDETNPGIYGELRGDILPRNPYLVLQEDPYSKFMNPPNQAQRSANLINSSLKFVVSLRTETLTADLTPKNGTPLTMNCYKNLFGTARIPTIESETGGTTPETTGDNGPNGPAAKGHSQPHQISIHRSSSNHIVIISNNQYYYLQVLTAQHEILFNDYDLSLIIQQIIDESNDFTTIESINNAIGSLTTQNYNYWKLARLELLKSNKLSVGSIDDALFVVVLDPNSPITDQDKTTVISHGSSQLSPDNIQIGSCTSRWYDKLQLIITKNSVAGVVWECTSTDSTAILRFISDIYTDSILKLAKNINAIEYTLFNNNQKTIGFVSNKYDKPTYKRMIFNITPELSNLIHLSETRLADLINQHLYTTIKIKLNSELLQTFGISTDSFLQICFQITHYSLYGKIANTLEPITTRKFKDARTELIAIQNDEISNLVKLFITNSSSAEKWDLFERCCKIHHNQYLDAMKGKGFERHLTSLLQVIKSERATRFLNELNPELSSIDFETVSNLYVPLLSNPILNRILTPELLISNCGNPALFLFGIPPPSDQGFGIGYIIHRDKVLLTLCSKFRQNDRFLSTLTKVITEFKSSLVSKSDFLMNLNQDNDHRRLELQKIRIEHELKNLNIDSPATRHPIELSIDQYTIPLSHIPLTNDHHHAVDLHHDDEAYESSNSTNSNEFDYLGGYGYFDFGELDSRNIELNRTQSYLNSPNLSSMSSMLHSRNHSSHSLDKDLKEKHDLNERIREKLNKSNDDLRFPQMTSLNEREKEKEKKKHEIGRPLDV